tara:strand:+ start:2840 stop:3154 length:315 start_codon:yes stop_codon:yes gene_type:complete
MKRNNQRTRKNSKVQKMTARELRNFVMKEAAALSGDLEDVTKVKAEEVEADEYADTLEQDIDMYKAMKVQEAKILKQYQKIVKEARKIRRNKKIAKKRILRKLK